MAKSSAVSAEVAGTEPAERRSWMPNSSRMSEQTFSYLLTIPVAVVLVALVIYPTGNLEGRYRRLRQARRRRFPQMA